MDTGHRRMVHHLIISSGSHMDSVPPKAMRGTRAEHDNFWFELDDISSTFVSASKLQVEEQVVERVAEECPRTLALVYRHVFWSSSESPSPSLDEEILSERKRTHVHAPSRKSQYRPVRDRNLAICVCLTTATDALRRPSFGSFMTHVMLFFSKVS